jgi:hypothetical protein
VNEHADNELDELRSLIADRLGTDWNVGVTASDSSNRVLIEISHPLSESFRMMLALGSGVMLARVAQRLDSEEITKVAAAPKGSHVGLLGDLRRAAAGGDWPGIVLADLARVLRRHDLLTGDEAEWLSIAGASRWDRNQETDH